MGNAYEFVGSQLFAVNTKMRLSTEASTALQQSTWIDPEERDIELLEVNQRLQLSDMNSLAEILQSVQPERFILAKPLTGTCLEALADYVSVDLTNLRSFNMVAPLPKYICQVARFLRRCPALERCYLRPQESTDSSATKPQCELTKQDVQELREEFQAHI